MHVTRMARPDCPHCQQPLSKWATPSFNFADGLGWGTDYLFVCFNDDCNFYIMGWEQMMTKYGHPYSYRYMEFPDSKQSGAIPVGSKVAAKGNIIDEEEERLMEEREAARLACIAFNNSIREQDKKGILNLLFDESISQEVRINCADYIGNHFELDMIDPLRDNTFQDTVVATKVNQAIEKIHSRSYTRECPYCAEIIKIRAKICKHCQREL